jgi:hypothetical protein
MGWRDNVEKTQTENFYCFFLSRIRTGGPIRITCDEVENMKISVNVPGDLTMYQRSFAGY